MTPFGSKLEYALQALIDLAQAGATTQSRDVAARQGLSDAYLDQVLLMLKRAGLVRSTRGAGGGHALARPTSQITVWDAALAVGAVVPCEGPAAVVTSSQAAAAVVGQLERETHQRLHRWLSAVTLADLAERAGRGDDALSVAIGL